MNSTATIISNGRLHINIDYWGRIKDVYFPYVGQENQLSKFINSYYFFYKGELIYLNEKDFKFEIDFLNDALISKCIVEHISKEWRIEFIDQVDLTKDVFYRDVRIVNQTKDPLDLSIYFENNFSLLESLYADTVLWHQPTGNFWHYKKDRHIVYGCDKEFFQFSCAAKEDNQGKGVLVNKDGSLDLNPISTGNVTSVFSIKVEVNGNKSKKFKLYYAFATTSSKAFKNARIGSKTNTQYLLQKRILQNSMKSDELFDMKRFSVLKEVFNQDQLERLFYHYNRSIMIMNSQIDERGAVIAGNDGQYLKQGGLDHYSYLWPRDAAIVAKALSKLNDRSNFLKVSEHTFKVLGNKGFFHHKYLPSANAKDVQLGSTWHSYITDQGLEILPIQEDATLLWCNVLLEYLIDNKKKLTLVNKYLPILKKMLKFLIRHSFINDTKHEHISKYVSGFPNKNGLWFEDLKDSYLPLPSYDIWEQYFGVFSFDSLLLLDVLQKTLTILEHNSDPKLEKIVIAHIFGLKNDIKRFLINENGQFIKGIRFDKDKSEIIKDETADSSFYMLCDNDVINEFDLQPTLSYLDSKLFLQEGVGGIARKENDHYLRVSEQFTGNPWFICSMWRLRLALRNNELEFAKNIMVWVLNHFDKTGLISEQTDPRNGYSLGIKPLTWSHAEYLLSVIGFIGYLQEKNK
jgi:GH15 family glucan-1,4-alpha-glucosidase